MPAHRILNTLPEFALILGYKEIFRDAPPQNRLDLLHGICKRSLVAEFAGMNYKLKPHNTIHQDTSLETQVELLKLFCGMDDRLYRHYARIIESYTLSREEYPLIFTRGTCLFALEEIVQSNLVEIENFSMSKIEVWDSIFKYILAVNSRITDMEKEDMDVGNFETLNPKMLPLNQLLIETDPFNVPFRGYKLMEYLSLHPLIGTQLANYFQKTFSLTFDRFIYEILGMVIANRQPDPKIDFYYWVNEENEFLFDRLSQKFPSVDHIKLLSIKKFPFYKRNKLQYYLFDSALLIEKAYNQFMWDFWFDWLKDGEVLKGNKKVDIKNYKAIVGYFFESYTKELIDHSFKSPKQSKNFVIKQFEELKARNKEEIADLYIRNNSKIIFGQVKSVNIYDAEKYSGNIDTFYKNDRAKFFSSFGIDQLIGSIKKMDVDLPFVDSKFPAYGTYQVFPVLIVSEKSLQTPFMSKILHDRFKELLVFPISKKVHIYPLSVIHISDLENLQDFLHENPTEIWDLLKYHCRNSVFMPPFYNTNNRKGIQPSYQRTNKLFYELVEKFAPK